MMNKLIIFMVLVISVGTANGHGCQSRQFLHEGRCCDMCWPGMHVVKNCTMTVQTSCKSCESGTVTNGWNAKSTCENCPDGMYYDVTLSYCMSCRTCLQGEYPMKTCSKIQNTQCSVCPENHYSDVLENKNTTCKACTSCKKILKPCTKVNDAICDVSATKTTTEPKRTGIWTIWSYELTTEPNLLTTTVKVKTSYTNGDDNIYRILAAGLISLLIVVLLVIFFIARKKSRCQRGRSGFPERNRTKYAPLRTGLLLRDQPASLLLKLVELLNPEGRRNWKDLAAEFKDFSWDEIANFAVDKSTAAEKMLCSWQAKNTATVDKLHSGCLAIGREDVATYVADFFISSAAGNTVSTDTAV